MTVDTNKRISSKALWLLHTTFLLFFGGLMLLATWRLPVFLASMKEDAWAEWATFYAFAVAGIFGVIAFVRSFQSGGVEVRPNPKILPPLIPRLLLLGLALFCLFVAGEEISWGQRLFVYKPPDIFLEENYQQELNFHNFLKDKHYGFGPIEIGLDSKFLVANIAIVYGILFPVIVSLLPLWHPKRGHALKNLPPPSAFIPWFALVAWVEMSYPVKFAGEAAELALGLLFLSDILLRIPPGLLFPARSVQSTFPVAAIGIVLLLGIATPSTIEAFRFESTQQDSAQARKEVALILQDISDREVVQPLLIETSKVHKRIFTAVKQGYLQFGDQSLFLENQPSPAEAEKSVARTDRRGYFLDPWNNPYWIYYRSPSGSAATLEETVGGALIVYSMGPNRRQETDLDRLKEEFIAGHLEGDDIGAGFALSH